MINTTQSSSYSTGSMVVNGGVGISQNLNVAGTTIATSTSTGAFILNGGACIQQRLFVTGVNAQYASPFEILNARPAGDNIYRLSRAVAPNLGANESCEHFFGRADTANNGGSFGFVYAGDGSADNRIRFNLFLSADLLNIYNNKIVVTPTTQAVSISTGSLIISGGLGVAKNLYVGNDLTFSGVASRITFPHNDDYKRLTFWDAFNNNYDFYGFGKISLGVALNIPNDDHFMFRGPNISGATASSNVNIMKIQSTGNVGQITIYSTLNTSSTTTGALLVNGGVSIAKNLLVNNDIACNGTIGCVSLGVNGTTDTTSTSTGVLQVIGGMAISKGLTLGGKTIYNTSTIDITGAGPFNNVVVPNSSMVYLTGTITNLVHITGFDSTGVVNGQQFRLIGYYASNVTVIIDHDSASSSSTNRIYTNSGGNVNMVLNPISASMFVYNSSLSKWLLICVDP